MVVADTVCFKFEADLFKSVQVFLGFCCHGQRWDVSQSEKGVAETVGFNLEADLFKSIPMIPGFGGHGQHLDFSQSEHGWCRSRWFRIRSKPFQISTSWTTFSSVLPLIVGVLSVRCALWATLFDCAVCVLFEYAVCVLFKKMRFAYWLLAFWLILCYLPFDCANYACDF